MPVLLPTDHYGEITYLGIVADRDAALESRAVDQITALFSGPEGETHGGLTRPSCSRVTGQYKRNTVIANVRQFSILSFEELAAIATDMGLDHLDPALLGATMVLRGIPDFTHIPPSSRLIVEAGASLCVDMENLPCTLPAKPIEAHHEGKGRAFKPAAKNRRGVTGWVEAEGILRLGMKMRLHIPAQRAWHPEGGAAPSLAS